jgi:hypothetical protein
MGIQMDTNGNILAKPYGELSNECCCKCIEKCPSACYNASPRPCGGKGANPLASRSYTLGGFTLNCFFFMNGSGTMVAGATAPDDCEWGASRTGGLIGAGTINLECFDGEWLATVVVASGQC